SPSATPAFNASSASPANLAGSSASARNSPNQSLTPRITSFTTNPPCLGNIAVRIIPVTVIERISLPPQPTFMRLNASPVLHPPTDVRLKRLGLHPPIMLSDFLALSIYQRLPRSFVPLP